MQGSTRSAPLALQIVKAIFFSFLGVRKRIDMQGDLDRLPLLPVILAGVLTATLFVGAVLLVVRMVVSA
jgi:hypothetical protein